MSKYQIHKFGGASLKDAPSVRRVAEIIKTFKKPYGVVVSAMGKTTNALEKVVNAYFNQQDWSAELNKVREFHINIINELFKNNLSVNDKLHNLFVELEWELEEPPAKSFDFHYDQIVAFGELLSSTILSEYLKKENIPVNFVDARDIIKTDDSYRHAKINWELTQSYAKQHFNKKINFITQGFIGVNDENYNTTLGREGSDFSAAVFAYVLDAEKVTIWKDVPGMLNADPKQFNFAQPLSNISFHEAVELAYYGASVIHPKTIKPLQNKQIPLYVKSFLNPENSGTLINQNNTNDGNLPSFILKKNQWLISVSANDFSFILENNIRDIFQIISSLQVTVNLMEHSALSFSVCVDDDFFKIPELIKILQKQFSVKYNKNVELLTIRHYSEELLQKMLKEKVVLLEQKSRNTARFVLK